MESRSIDFENVTNSLEQGVIILDAHFKIIYFNNWVYERTGYTSDVIMNQPFDEIFPSLKHSRLMECIEQSVQMMLPSRLSNSFNPSPFPLYDPLHIGNEFYRLQQMLIVKPHRTKNTDQSTYCEILIQDVTSRVIKEALLKSMAKERQVEAERQRKERNQLQRIINNTADAILSFSPGRAIDLANQRAEQMFAMSRQQIMQTTFEELFARYSKDRNMVEERMNLFIQRVFADRSPGSSVFYAELVNQDEHSFPVEVKFSAVLYDDQLSIVAMIRDLTLQKEAERTLKESENRYKTLTKVAPVGIFEADLVGVCTYANATWFQITGQFESCLHSIMWFDIALHEDKDFLRHKWEEGKETQFRERVEFRVDRGEGEVWVLCQIMANLDSFGRICGYVGTLTDISDQRLSRKKIEELAYYDPLTDLANRRLFKDRLDQTVHISKRHRSPFALLALDLDDFKQVNDTLGHDSGDTLLIEVAQRLKNIVREEDTICRVGGDEFTIILKSTNSIEDISMIAKKVAHSIQRPYGIAGEVVNVSTSVGISCFPGDGMSSDELIKNADLAMYAAKQSGKNQCTFYNAAMNKEVERRRQIERHLHNIIKEEVFEIYYQPQLDLNTGTVVGAEALLRWFDGNGVMQGPQQLVAVAESNGMIKQLGRMVLSKAFFHLRQLMDMECVGENFVLALNISARQFLNPSMPFDIWRLMKQYGISGKNIELEITESVWLKEFELANKVLECLKHFNVRVSVDDFGTGFSSLSYLYKLPIDKLKIDQSFVADLDNNTRAEVIINTITAVATKLSMDVIAEGIEDAYQLKRLQELNCRYGQGYFLSKPLSFEGIMHFLNGQRNPSESLENKTPEQRIQ